MNQNNYCGKNACSLYPSKPSPLGQGCGSSVMTKSPLFQSTLLRGNQSPSLCRTGCPSPSPKYTSLCNVGERRTQTPRYTGTGGSLFKFPTTLPQAQTPTACTVPRSPRECNFCRNNGESREHYRSHALRHPTSGTLICPILRGYRCDTCGATGDNAHTRNYCPLKESQKRALPMELKCTQRQSNGHFRRQC